MTLSASLKNRACTRKNNSLIEKSFNETDQQLILCRGEKAQKKNTKNVIDSI